ncbi:uncharacterized protein LOC143363221 isoform X5 [Halictus rubicundus]|uniref:uncharacterized protein LOC143363221 isoform X5 n=1 Tax=Halictus rubicundus TaxID=77578 RepID=UPI004035D4D6
MSRTDHFAVLFAFLCTLGFVHAIYDPEEATTKPPYRREPVLPWYLSSQDDHNSTEDQSRSPKWQIDPDNPIPTKPYIVNAETKTWSPWRKTSASEIEHRTQIATDSQSPINFNQDRDYLYNSRDLDQHQDGNQARLKENSENVKSNQDFYEGISPDNTKPRKEELSLSSNLKSMVARYDPRQGVQCPDVDSTGQFIYLLDCKFFVNCWKGRAFVQPCAPGTLFSPDTLECDFPHKVNCYGGELADFLATEHLDSFGRKPFLPSFHTSVGHEKLQEPRCPPHVTGLLPYPSDCKKFLQCANGGTIVMNCGPGTVFNPAISVCDWPDAVKGCEDSLESKKDTTTLFVPSEYGTYGNEKLESSEHQPMKKIACPPHHTGLLPHPDTCKKFLQCTNGGTFIMDCGPGTAFNPVTTVCDWPYNVPSCSEEKTTTARPWSSVGSSDSGKWDHGRQYNWTSKATTSRPNTDWEALRPTWRPNWMSNTWTTAKPPETDSDASTHTWKLHWAPNTWSTAVPPNLPENSGSPTAQWQHSENRDETYHHHQHHHHNHHHYPHASIYDSNKRTESQQPAPPYDSSQPQGPKQPTSDSSWHSNSGQHRHHDASTQSEGSSYFDPSGSWHSSSGHRHSLYGKPHSTPHYPEYDDSDQQTQQKPFDQEEDPSNTRVPSQPEESRHSVPSGSSHSSSEYHNYHYGKPHSTSHYPVDDESDEQTQRRPFDQTEDSSISHVRFDEGNLLPNRGTEHVFTSNKKEYSRSRSGSISPPGENIYVDNTRKLPEDLRPNGNRQTTRNRTSWTLMVPSSSSHQGPSPQPQNRPWDQEEPPFPSYYVPPVEPLDHSRKVTHPTPISGQVIRLRGGSGPHDGYVEVQGKIPGWGIICDSSWTLKEADVVCKQLGYARGAEMAWKGRDNRNGIPTWVAANSVSCQGNETRFQLCKFTHEPECRVERDAVGVRCVLNRIAHCRKGEIPYEGHCYHLADPDSGSNHAEALVYCSQRQSRLIDITTQAENDFVSEWLLQKHPEVGSVMTSGVGFTAMSHTIWLWEDSSRAKFKYSKWWPGWMEDKNHPPIVGSRPVCVVMKRKFPCHERPDSLCVADYFFWDAEDCATFTKGHFYICKRPYDDIGCVYGKGGQYAGNANVTAAGKPCLPWSDEKVAHSLSILTLNREVKEKLKTHNYCRNPQPLKESSPWCFAGLKGQREYCDIPPCGNIESQRSRLSGQCKPRHFECLPGECIPSPWVCDGEEDCTNGADERACTSHMDLFQKHAKHKLEGHDVEKWLNTPLKTCALRCKEADFTCRSFSHKATGNICLLSNSNIGMTGSLKPNREFDYYEMRERSINCDGMFVCDNRKCINQIQVCNGKNDCNDRSDESICTVENLDYAIRLSGSDNTYEGRIEVKILGVWGQVCDDGFGMNDANVICKELGFDLGALEIRPGGFYGNLNPPTRFIVDQLQCRGNETSLRECDFEGWGVHNCRPEEAVGVVCKTAVDTCQADYWKCDTSPTCILNAYICDEVVDCPDGSDESTEHCDAPFEIRLANGSTPLEGRVEVRHHGIWGTVCDDDFSNAAATVICRSLGYEGKAIVRKDGFFGPGEGPIWLDEVSCRGNETQLYRCDHNNWGRHNCDHNEDAGVICTRRDVNDSKLQSNWSPVLETNINDILPANCGRRFKDFNDDEDLIFGKVVHGNIAAKGSYPWQASLRVRGHSRSSHWCGAVVLSPLHVLTAAHCLEGYNKGTYFVRAGDYNTERDEGTEAEANIEDYYIHEDFRKGHRMNNDIALVLLKGRGIPLGKDVMPICLPHENIEYPSGLNCTISGFGSIKTGTSTHSNDLRYGWVPLLDQSVCRAGHVYGEGAISDGMFCAGYLDEGVDTCDGDSGGPLACYHNGAFTLYGITSWGQHCGKVNKPGVYVRVSYYRRWIDQKIKESLSGR